jgi:hypothetical protein
VAVLLSDRVAFETVRANMDGGEPQMLDADLQAQIGVRCKPSCCSHSARGPLPSRSAFALCFRALPSLSLSLSPRAGGARTPYTCALTPRPRRTIVQAQGDQTVDQMQQQKQQQQQQQQQKAEIMNSILSPEAQQRRAWASFFFFSPASPLARVTSLHRRPLRRSSATLTLAQLAACACLAQSVASPWSTRPRWIRWR